MTAPQDKLTRKHLRQLDKAGYLGVVLCQDLAGETWITYRTKCNMPRVAVDVFDVWEALR